MEVLGVKVTNLIMSELARLNEPNQTGKEQGSP
jgi:hypothetical protein